MYGNIYVCRGRFRGQKIMSAGVLLPNKFRKGGGGGGALFGVCAVKWGNMVFNHEAIS